MDSRVPATIALHLAKADLKVAELERLEQSTPNLRSNSNQRIVIARKLKAARELAHSWLVVVSLVAADQFAEEEEQAGLDKEFKAAPERTVGWMRYVENSRNQVVCNRALCKNPYPSGGPKWVAIREAGDVDTDHTQCDQCGEVLSA